MLDFIRKKFVFEILDQGLPKEIGAAKPYHLKTVQDCAVFGLVAGLEGASIAEIGGGDSRLIRKLARKNQCVNVEKFQGADNGPDRPVRIRGVKTVEAFLGEFSERLQKDQFDAVFSVSVVEHVATDKLDAFFEDGMRILKSGGLWAHAIDMYVGSAPTPANRKRLEVFQRWADFAGKTEPVGDIFTGEPVFAPDMASNPDNVMHAWGVFTPSLIELRERAQCVSLLLAARKR
ncbi:MAG: class I SAM-dependent methyltransferase [Pseudomonadota bacterium]